MLSLYILIYDAISVVSLRDNFMTQLKYIKSKKNNIPSITRGFVRYFFILKSRVKQLSKIWAIIIRRLFNCDNLFSLHDLNFI